MAKECSQVARTPLQTFLKLIFSQIDITVDFRMSSAQTGDGIVLKT